MWIMQGSFGGGEPAPTCVCACVSVCCVCQIARMEYSEKTGETEPRCLLEVGRHKGTERNNHGVVRHGLEANHGPQGHAWEPGPSIKADPGKYGQRRNTGRKAQ